MSIQILCLFLKLFLNTFKIIYINNLCISKYKFNIRNTLYATIFSNYICYLLTFLMVSFESQMFLILMRFDLPIFLLVVTVLLLSNIGNLLKSQKINHIFSLKNFICFALKIIYLSHNELII